MTRFGEFSKNNNNNNNTEIKGLNGNIIIIVNLPFDFWLSFNYYNISKVRSKFLNKLCIYSPHQQVLPFEHTDMASRWRYSITSSSYEHRRHAIAHKET